MATIHRTFRNFVDWWFAALGTLLPHPLRKIFRNKPPAHVLVYDQSGLKLQKATGAKTVSLWFSGTSAEDQQSPGSPSTPKISNWFGQELRVLINPECAVQTEFSLPPVAMRDLPRLAENEIERQTPFRADQVYFGARYTEPFSGQKMRRVELAVIRKEPIEEILTTVKDLGFRIERILVGENNPDGADATVIQSRSHSERWQWSPSQALCRVLLAGVVLLIAANIYAYESRMRSTVLALDNQTVKARAAAFEAQKAADQKSAAEKKQEFLVNRYNSNNLLDRVLALTRSLPDSAWIFQLELRGEVIEISGYADDASSLISRLEASPSLHDVKFTAPVARAPTSGKERFRISAKSTGDAR